MTYAMTSLFFTDLKATSSTFEAIFFINYSVFSSSPKKIKDT